MTLSKLQITKLWDTFQVFDAEGNGSISLAELEKITTSLGQNLTPVQLRDMIKEVDTDLSGSIDFEEFLALIVSQQGDRLSRLQLAFSVFDENNNGQITIAELKGVMSRFGLTEAELQEIIQEVDHDGDGSIDLEEFMQLVPEKSEIKAGYQDTPIPAPKKVSAPFIAPAVTTPEKPTITTSKGGTSRLQMQIGLFRLIQGAAYRSFRESFSAHHETHLQVKNLPYRISDFLPFVEAAIALYKGLGIVKVACYPLLDAVVDSIKAEYTRLQERIQNWPTLAKTPEMLAQAEAMEAARQESTNLREKFAAGVEFAITLKKKHLSFRDVTEGLLAINELNRLRQIELNQEEEELTSPRTIEDAKAYLKQWHRVILQETTEAIEGAMMPVAYWYEDFMPKLLTAFTVETPADIPENTIPDEISLNQWYESAQEEFGRFGTEVRENFPHCTPSEKLAIKQAWRLTHHYLNGVQKRRERQEFGRESGGLSHYVAFIDVYLGRTDVRDSQMRISFPYYIGPGVWRFFHTTAEIICTKSVAEQTILVQLVKDFILCFARMYPCPYCRHHFNAYVILNKEVDMYPMEYLLLGRDKNLQDLGVYLDAKLSTVVDGKTLRLFFWKLHNTVSSSIARSEEWYRKDERAFYTTRYWPSLDSELARAKALGLAGVETERLEELYGILKPIAQLAALRKSLGELVMQGETARVQEACLEGEVYIQQLENAILEGEFLEKVYRFDPTLKDENPFFTPEEESFARSGQFIEV